MTAQSRYRRPAPKRRVQARILVVCEGETEKNYLSEFRRFPGLNAIEVVVAGVPTRVVDRARKMSESPGAAGPFTEVWVVFDCDGHPGLDDAHRNADDLGFGIASSNPCFELWPVLHVQDQRAHIDTKHAERLCKKLYRGWRKPDSLYPLCERSETEACRRAKELRKWHLQNGNKGTSNPSTLMDALVLRLREIASEHGRALP